MIGDVLNQSNLVVGRAGANTLCELLVLGKKAILIPIPKTSHDEQYQNAVFFEKSGLGIMLDQNLLTDDLLYNSILELIERHVDLDTIHSARELVQLDAAERVADLVLTTV
jgi:UDP-N-acetylglucosamine--N-acetylmuramyl-(pentapeptide) pyrophosphoryl-undecaprenol N-acetylglucosamine transferase